MRLLSLPLDEAEGTYLAHAVTTPSGTLRKGIRLTAAVLQTLRAAGVASVTAARLEAGDLHEDEAADRLGTALCTPFLFLEPPGTGRANLFAAKAGLLEVDAAAVTAINRIDPAITLATRPPMRAVRQGQMVATVKIIPFAVPENLITEAVRQAKWALPFRLLPFKPLRVAALSTLLPHLKPSVIDKTLRVFDKRLAPAGARIVHEKRLPHTAEALRQALEDIPEGVELTVIFGASAIIDRNDVIPAALVASGGRVLHLGMPVDPGNLLLLGERGGRPVIGAPGCARSPQENGFDFILERVLAGRMPDRDEIVAMGAGGLLMEIVSRPAPRGGEAMRENPDTPHIAALLLAAGMGRRFASGNKLLSLYKGMPLICHAARAALEAGLAEVVVVTGHEGDKIAAALKGLPVRLCPHADFEKGQASSLQAGLAALSPRSEAVVVLLGDMPLVTAETVKSIAAAYAPATGSLIVTPVHQGKRGNPVLFSRRFFPELMALAGDEGARGLIPRYPEAVTTVDCGPEVSIDIDTAEALAALDDPARTKTDP